MGLHCSFMTNLFLTAFWSFAIGTTTVKMLCVCVELGGLMQLQGPERVSRTFLGSFWPGLSNLLSISALALVYGTVFKVQDFNAYVVYLGIGLVVWNGISAAIGSAPNLFEHNHSHVHNTNLNPIFMCWKWAFQLQTFLQSFALVVIALSDFNIICFLIFWYMHGFHC